MGAHPRPRSRTQFPYANRDPISLYRDHDASRGTRQHRTSRPFASRVRAFRSLVYLRLTCAVAVAWRGPYSTRPTRGRGTACAKCRNAMALAGPSGARQRATSSALRLHAAAAPRCRHRAAGTALQLASAPRPRLYARSQAPVPYHAPVWSWTMDRIPVPGIRIPVVSCQCMIFLLQTGQGTYRHTLERRLL